jgi:hypothetical protein
VKCPTSLLLSRLTPTVLTLLVLAAPVRRGLAQGGITPLAPDAMAYGLSLAEWAAAWNQWWTSIPKATYPGSDPTGQYCGVGQRMPVWFLPVFEPGEHTLECTVPAGQAIFFGVEYFAWSSFSLTDLTRAIDEAPVPEASIDGVVIPDIKRYRVQTPIFTIILNWDNVLGYDVPYGESLAFPAAAEGYYILMPPLPAGKHVIHTQASIGGDDLIWTFNLTNR